ncbi:MAG: hypothetical protein DMG15_14825, partial [Acidobacteria bacterium]
MEGINMPENRNQNRQETQSGESRRFRNDSNGWWALETRGENIIKIFVCGQVQFVSATRDHENSNWGTLCRFADSNGVQHT